MKRRYLAASAVLLCSLFMYGCVASEGDVGFIYTRQKDIEANLKKAEKDIEWLKTEVSNEDANLEIKEQVYELQNKMLELEQVVGTVHSGVETMKTDILKSADDAERREAEAAAGNETSALMKRIGELEARVSQLEKGTQEPLAAPAPPTEPASQEEAAEEKPEPVKSETAEPQAAQSRAPAEKPAPAEPEAPATETPAQKPAQQQAAQSGDTAEKPAPAEPEAPATETPAQKPAQQQAAQSGDTAEKPEPEASAGNEAAAAREPAEPEDDSKGTGAYYDLGKKKLAEGEYGDARVLFRKYADANPVAPDAPEAVFLIADSYFMEKLYEEAILEYQNLIDIYPDSPRVTTSQLKQGIALLEIEKPNEAALFFESLIESHPRSPEAAEAGKYLKKIKPKAAE